MRWFLPGLALVLAASCRAPQSDVVDGRKAHALVAAGARLVDVRTPEEYAEGHVEGAENVPVDTIASHDFGVKTTPLVLYCRSGKRSANAATTLRSKGYTSLHDLGAMSNWGTP